MYFTMSNVICTFSFFNLRIHAQHCSQHLAQAWSAQIALEKLSYSTTIKRVPQGKERRWDVGVLLLCLLLASLLIKPPTDKCVVMQ